MAAVNPTPTPVVAPPRPMRFFNGLSEDDQTRLVAFCEPLVFEFGAVIVRQGEAGDTLFIVQSGRVRVVQETEDDDEIVLTSLHPGDVFGEISLLKNTPRGATVRASRATRVLRLDRKSFQKLIAERPHIGQLLEDHASGRLLFNILKHARSLDRLPEAVLRDVVRALKRTEFRPGQKVITEGDPPGPMYIVEQGKLKVSKRGESGRSKNLDFLREGDFFGEASALANEPRSATVEAVTPCCLFSLDSADLRQLFTRWPQFKRAMEERVASFDYQREANVPLDFSEELLPAQTRSPTEAVEDHLESLPKAVKPGKPAKTGGFWHKLFRSRKPARTRHWRFPFIRQVDEADCGVACLAMICRHYGRRVSPAHIRMLAHTAIDGTSLRNLCHAAHSLGLAARPVKVSQRNLEQIPLPAILHWDDKHWVVLVEIQAERVRIADPAVALEWLPRKELEEHWNGYTALFDYTEAFEQAPQAQPSLAWFWPYVRPQLPLLRKVFSLTLISTALAFIAPVLTQVIVDRVVVEGAADLLAVVLLAMAVVLVFQTAASLLQGYIMAFAAMHIDTAAFDSLTRKLLALPVGYFQARRTGDIQRRLDGARQVRQLLVSNSLSAIVALTQLGAALGLMALYSPFMMLVYLCIAPFYGGLLLVAVRYLRPLYDKLEKHYGEYRSEQIDAIKGIESVKTGAAEHTLREKLLDYFTRAAQQQFKADYTILVYQGTVNALGLLTVLLFLWLGAKMALSGAMTLGSFVAFTALVALANAPIVILLRLWEELQLAQVLVHRLGEIFEYEPEQGRDHKRLLPVHSLSGALEFRGLSFRYGGLDAPYILRHINLKIPAGKTFAIVGRSGSGKSTFVKLLAGLLEPTEGSILYDGVDMRILDYQGLRRRIGYVLQENHVFNGSVLENIAFGAETDLKRAINAAKAASAHEFIERLPLGYETQLGESGVRLSGGQTQRITIARAIYRNPAVLILDEATSALDAETEREVQEKMDVVFAGRTALVIAHRLSTIRNADRIIVLEKGEIAEQGDHEELMDRRGIYFYLVSRQIET